MKDFAHNNFRTMSCWRQKILLSSLFYIWDQIKFRRNSTASTRVEVFGWIFVRNAVNAVNFCKKCGDCGWCGEKNYFTAFHRIYKNSPRNSPHAYKKSPHRFLWPVNLRNEVNAVNAVQNNNSPPSAAFLTKIHSEIHIISLKSHHIGFSTFT